MLLSDQPLSKKKPTKTKKGTKKTTEIANKAAANNDFFGEEKEEKKQEVLMKSPLKECVNINGANARLNEENVHNKEVIADVIIQKVDLASNGL